MVTASRSSLFVKFLNPDGGNFASCEITRQWVENIKKCVDSSKGCIAQLYLENSGKTKEEDIGIVFKDRKDALHFKMCFSELDKKVEREENIMKSEKRNTDTIIHRKNNFGNGYHGLFLFYFFRRVLKIFFKMKKIKALFRMTKTK